MICCEIRSTRLAKDYRHQSVQPEIVGTSEPIETFFTANKTRQGQFVLKYRLACGIPTFEYKTKRGNDRGKMINDQNLKLKGEIALQSLTFCQHSYQSPYCSGLSLKINFV